MNLKKIKIVEKFVNSIEYELLIDNRKMSLLKLKFVNFRLKVNDKLLNDFCYFTYSTVTSVNID